MPDGVVGRPAQRIPSVTTVVAIHGLEALVRRGGVLAPVSASAMWLPGTHAVANRAHQHVVALGLGAPMLSPSYRAPASTRHLQRSRPRGSGGGTRDYWPETSRGTRFTTPQVFGASRAVWTSRRPAQARVQSRELLLLGREHQVAFLEQAMVDTRRDLQRQPSVNDAPTETSGWTAPARRDPQNRFDSARATATHRLPPPDGTRRAESSLRFALLAEVVTSSRYRIVGTSKRRKRP